MHSSVTETTFFEAAVKELHHLADEYNLLVSI